MKSFNNFDNIKETITYFEGEIRILGQISKGWKVMSTILKTFKRSNIFVNTAAISCSVTLSITEFGLNAIPISIRVASGLTVINEVSFEIIRLDIIILKNAMRKRRQQTINFFENVCRKCLEDIVFHKRDYEFSCKFLRKYAEGNKYSFFLKFRILNVNNFNNNEMKLNNYKAKFFERRGSFIQARTIPNLEMNLELGLELCLELRPEVFF